MEKGAQQGGELSRSSIMAELVTALTTAELTARAGLPRIEVLTVNERGYENKISAEFLCSPPAWALLCAARKVPPPRPHAFLYVN